MDEMDRMIELINQFIDQLTRDPQAAPPPGLDPQMADFVREVVMSLAVSMPDDAVRARVWRRALADALAQSESSTQPVSLAPHAPPPAFIAPNGRTPQPEIPGMTTLRMPPMIRPAQPETTRRPRPYVTLGIALAAAIWMLVVVGALLLVRPHQNESATDTPQFGSQGGTLTQPVSLQPTTNGSPAGTPTAVYQDAIGASGYPLVTTQPIGDLPANTRVRVSQAWYNGSEWRYIVVAEDEWAVVEAAESQLAYAPETTPDPTHTPSSTPRPAVLPPAQQATATSSPLPPTPSALFQSLIGAPGYSVITTQQVNNIPPNTFVRISHGWYDGTSWRYGIVTQDEQTYGEAYEWQIAFGPGVTPGTPGWPTPFATPTAGYADEVFTGDPFVTLQQVGSIPPYTYVQVTGIWWSAETGWHYQLVSEDGQGQGEAFEWQLVPRSLFTPVSTTATPLPTPTCVPGFYFTEADREECGGIAVQTTMQAAYQLFEGGFMIWRSDTGAVLVFAQSGQVYRFAESSYASLPANPVTDEPPVGRVKPVSGFGRVWGHFDSVRALLGWAFAPEQGYTTTYQYVPDDAPVTATYIYLTVPDGRVVQVFNNDHWNFEMP